LKRRKYSFLSVCCLKALSWNVSSDISRIRSKLKAHLLRWCLGSRSPAHWCYRSMAERNGTETDCTLGPQYGRVPIRGIHTQVPRKVRAMRYLTEFPILKLETDIFPFFLTVLPAWFWRIRGDFPTSQITLRK
jgi:hypothetical protein